MLPNIKERNIILRLAVNLENLLLLYNGARKMFNEWHICWRTCYQSNFCSDSFLFYQRLANKSCLLNTKKHIHSISFEVYYVIKPFWNKWLIFANTHRCDENSVISTKKLYLHDMTTIFSKRKRTATMYLEFYCHSMVWKSRNVFIYV